MVFFLDAPALGVVLLCEHVTFQRSPKIIYDIILNIYIFAFHQHITLQALPKCSLQHHCEVGKYLHHFTQGETKAEKLSDLPKGTERACFRHPVP